MDTTHQVIEGTWDELARHAAMFNGRRLRLVVFTTADSQHDHIKVNSSCRYGDRVRATLSSISATDAEQSFEQKELDELIKSMNENRRNDGAEPLF